MELYQRIYRNALSLGETLLFFGLIIRLVASNKPKNNLVNYILSGLITSIMLLTREDSMWAFVIIIILIIYKVIVNKKINEAREFCNDPFWGCINSKEIASYDILEKEK